MSKIILSMGWLIVLATQSLIAEPLQREWARSLLQSFHLQGHERIVDLQCGSGTFTAEMAAQVPEGFVLGIDPDNPSVQIALATYDPDLFANLQFVDEPYHALQGPFDIAIAISPFDLNIDFSAMARAARETLTPNGQCLMAFSAPSFLLRQELPETTAPLPPPEWFEEKLGSFLNLTSIRAQTSHLCCSNREELEGWMSDYLKRLEVADEKAREMIAHYIAALPEGRWECPLDIVRIEATR